VTGRCLFRYPVIMLVDLVSLYTRDDVTSKESFDSALQGMSSEDKDRMLWAFFQEKNSAKEKLLALRQAVFGRSSEKTATLFDHLFDEAEAAEEVEEVIAWKKRLLKTTFLPDPKRNGRDPGNECQEPWPRFL